MKKIVILIIVFIVLAIGGVSLVKYRKKQLDSIRIETKLKIPVDTVCVRKGTFKNMKLYLGTLESNKQATIKARIQGQITKISKREGDLVKQGETIAELDGIKGSTFGTRKALEISIKNMEKSIAQMEKAVDNLKNIYSRDLNLYKNKAISKQALEISENKLKEGEIRLSNLKNGLANLQAKFSFYKIKSPFSGVISKVIVNIGDIVMPSMPLFQIENENNCKLVVTVASTDIPNIKKNETAKIIFNKKSIESKISRVYPSVKGQGVGTVEIDFENHPFNLPLGSKLSVEIPTQVIKNVLLLPENAVLTSQHNIVFKVNNNKIKIENVKILGSSIDNYAISGNLNEGDTVVKGSDSLFLRLSNGSEVILNKGE